MSLTFFNPSTSHQNKCQTKNSKKSSTIFFLKIISGILNPPRHGGVINFLRAGIRFHSPTTRSRLHCTFWLLIMSLEQNIITQYFGLIFVHRRRPSLFMSVYWMDCLTDTVTMSRQSVCGSRKMSQLRSEDLSCFSVHAFIVSSTSAVTAINQQVNTIQSFI